MVKTSITIGKGVTISGGSAIEIEGKDYHEAPFDDRWDDLVGVIHEGTGGSALTYQEYRDTGFFMRFFRHNQDDKLFVTYQMPHEWNHGAVTPHMHVVPMASGSGNVRMDFVYTWTHVGGALSGSAGWTTGSIDTTYTPADQYQQKIIALGTVTPPAASSIDSAIFVVKMERNAAGGDGGSDTYTTNKDHGTGAANLGLLSFDLHYQKEKAGSVSQYPEISGL